MIRSTTLALVALVIATAVLVACQTTEADGRRSDAPEPFTQRITEAEHRERVEQAWRDYEAALLDGDAAEALAMFSEEVTIRGSANTIHGRATYRERVEQFLSTTSLDYLKGEVEDVIVMGDHVFAAGNWSERFRRDDADASVSLRGSYAWLWRFENDGKWRIIQWVWNIRPDVE